MLKVRDVPAEFSARELAALMRATQQAVREWVREEKIIPLVKRWGDCRFTRDELLRSLPERFRARNYELLHVGEAAKRLGICHDSVRRLARQGVITGIYVVCHTLYLAEELKEISRVPYKGYGAPSNFFVWEVSDIIGVPEDKVVALIGSGQLAVSSGNNPDTYQVGTNNLRRYLKRRFWQQ